MKIISFIFLVICIVMLLHITLTNLLFGIDLKHHDFKSSKYWLIKAAIYFVILLTIVIVAICIKDTQYSCVLDCINTFIIGFIISNYYIKYL